MARYIASRVPGLLVVLVGISLVVFVGLRLTGDPASLLVDPDSPQEVRDQLRRELGLDQPITTQYFRFVQRLLVGDLGESYQFRKPSIEVVWQAVPATLQLTAFALLVTVLIGIPLGILSAKFRGSIFDLVVSTITLIGQSMPNFWLGILLILLFSVHWGVMPTSGRGDFAQMIMPALTLAAHPISKFTRLARAEFLDQFGQDYVRTARAKGLRESLVIFRHILRNAALPIITLIGTDLGYLLSGAVIVETVFAWPGLGRLTIQAIERRDFPLVQACVLFSALMVVLVSILMDVIYSWTDPRVRLG